MKRAVFGVAVVALAACRDRAAERAPSANASASGAAASVVADAASNDATANAAIELRAIAMKSLPGLLAFVEESHDATTLVCAWHGGYVASAVQTYPSAHALDDGRIVAIASTGDGSERGEGLEVVACKTGSLLVEAWGPRGRQIREPAVIPDNRGVIVAANLDGHSDLYRIANGPGHEHVRLTNDPAGNFHPAILDDKTLIFVSSRDGNSEIYRMPIAGGAATRLTFFHKDDWHPVPSPDGKQVAFLSDREGRPRIFLMSPTGTQQRRLTKLDAKTGDGATLDELDPLWSPDGKRLLYTLEKGARRRVILHELATGIEHELTPPDASDADATWSPDGAWIAVARTLGDRTDLFAIATRLTDATRSTLRITNSAAKERIPRWFARHPD